MLDVARSRALPVPAQPGARSPPLIHAADPGTADPTCRTAPLGS